MQAISLRVLARRRRDRLQAVVHPALYLAQLDAAQRAKLGPAPSIDDTIRHYLAYGAARGLRLCGLFSPDWYAARLAALGARRPRAGAGASELFAHWLNVGWSQRIVPTPLFDEEFYRERHPAIASQPGWAFEHYLRVGCYEPRWNPSPVGKHHSVVGPVPRAPIGEPLLLRQLLHHGADFDLARTSWLEEGVVAALDVLDQVATPEIDALVERAIALEPLIAESLRRRPIAFCPPHRGPRVHLASVAEDVRRRIGRAHASTVVLVPDASALDAVAAADAVVLGTDRPSAGDRDGFIDLADDLAAFNLGRRVDLLVDVVRGLGAERIVCAGSAEGAAMLAAYGRQLAAGAVVEQVGREAG